MTDNSGKKGLRLKRCFVPMCGNTTAKTPNKLFICVPDDFAKREKWCKQMGRDSYGLKSTYFVCEDHFDLPNDMINYIKYRVMGKVSRVLLKPGCYPTKFDCQAGLQSLKYKKWKQRRKINMGIAECLVTDYFNISSDMKTETHLLSEVCSACLARGRELQNSHKIKECFQLITDIQIPDETNLQVCWECMAYIRTIFKFKASIESSQKILNEYNLKCLSDEDLSKVCANCPQRLQLSSCEVIDFFPDPEVSVDDFEIKDENISSPEYLSESSEYFDVQIDDEEPSSCLIESVDPDLVSTMTSTNYLEQEDDEETDTGELKCSNGDSKKCDISSEQTQDLKTMSSEPPSSRILGETKEEAKNKTEKNANYLLDLDEQMGDEEPSSLVESVHPDIAATMMTSSNYLEQENGEKTDTAELMCSSEDFENCIIIVEQNQNLKTKSKKSPSCLILRKRKKKAKKKEKKFYICDYCSLKCYNKNNLGRHILKHTMVKAFSCDICSCKFSNKSQLKTHIYSHKRKRLFRCEFCSYKSISFTRTVAHEASHTGAKPFSCASCTYTTNTRTLLIKHLKIHTDDYKYQCNFCSYKSRYLGCFKVHTINHHSDEKPFKCKVCSLQFSTKNGLTKHMLTHTGEKAFFCEICAKMFASLSNLKYHMLRHTGTKKYICDICLFRCNYKGNLKAHILRAHKNKCIMAK